MYNFRAPTAHGHSRFVPVVPVMYYATTYNRKHECIFALQGPGIDLSWPEFVSDNSVASCFCLFDHVPGIIQWPNHSGIKRAICPIAVHFSRCKCRENNRQENEWRSCT